jgi:hypothetical protein
MSEPPAIRCCGDYTTHLLSATRLAEMAATIPKASSMTPTSPRRVSTSSFRLSVEWFTSPSYPLGGGERPSAKHGLDPALKSLR